MFNAALHEDSLQLYSFCNNMQKGAFKLLRQVWLMDESERFYGFSAIK